VNSKSLTLLDMIGVVAAAFAIVACFAMFFMIPTFTHMFEDFEAALPVPTLLVIQRWPVVLATLVSAGLLLVGAIGLGSTRNVAKRVSRIAALRMDGAGRYRLDLSRRFTFASSIGGRHDVVVGDSVFEPVVHMGRDDAGN
jgi:hypothetical protein